MPACAVCRQPLDRAEKFVLLGTEVVHPRCVRSGRKTVLQIACDQLSQRAANDVDQHELARLRAEVIELRAAQERWTREREELSRRALRGDRVDSLERDLQLARADAENRRAAIRTQATAAQDLAAENERLRRELAVYTVGQSGGARPGARPTPDVAPAEQKQESLAEASSARFGLLELD